MSERDKSREVTIPGEVAIAAMTGRMEFLDVWRKKILDGKETLSREMALDLVELVRGAIQQSVDDKAGMERFANRLYMIRGNARGIEKAIEELADDFRINLRR